MSSKQLYDSIFEEHIQDIINNRIKTDKYLKTESIDNRRGISLIIPISFTNCVYTDLINEYKNIEPDQYYYPEIDLHITVFTFLSARETYINNEDKNRQFKSISEYVLQNIRAFNILLDGITFSKEAGFINGYDNNILINIRDSIRIGMKKSGLKIDERYKSETAHITFTRFVNPLNDNRKLAGKIYEDRNKSIDEITIRKIELVEHDWYNKKAHKKVFKTFEI